MAYEKKVMFNKFSKERMKKTILILIIVSFSLVTACKPKHDPIFFDSTTNLPGWRGIIPGETTLNDALITIKNFSEFDTKSVCSEQFVSYGYETIRCHLSKTARITLYADEGKIQTISLKPDEVSIWYYFFNPNSTTLERAIEELGEPELVINSGRSSTSWYDQFLINPEIGYKISYPPEYSRNKRWPDEIFPKGRIWSILYFNPEIFSELIERGLINAGITSTPEETWERMQPWKGYGVIPELYPADKD